MKTEDARARDAQEGARRHKPGPGSVGLDGVPRVGVLETGRGQEEPEVWRLWS